MNKNGSRALVHRPAKNAMQSGTFRGDLWYVEFEPSRSQYVEGLMGWTGSEETLQQVRMCFESKEDAVAYVEAHGIPYILLQDATASRVPKSYATNFLRKRGL
ncbi:ETC complex I subunit [Anaplasma phagocytophilum]|uniref:Putative oxidoreductase n=1 Tax=Anaplasma phagocytophilum TaxID=948 RepID=A0A098EH19_ANAPH|nr:ETC complex I subunit [Anaplasma phagocytophilum]CEG21090.1 Putative oxidoreductase [Anaplasma phagocytophilum]